MGNDENVNYKILFKSEHFLVCDKKCGLSVHATSDGQKNLVDLISAEINQKLYLVNRLDKETSGLVVMATGPEIATELMQNWNNFEKYYLAVLRGKYLSIGNKMVWNYKISDKAEGVKNPQGLSKERLNSKTEIHIIDQNKYFTKIQALLLTGRQHQIRKHAALSGHHIVCDLRYGDKKYNQMIENKYSSGRLMLHCKRIVMNLFGTPYEFTSDAPKEFEILLSSEDKK